MQSITRALLFTLLFLSTLAVVSDAQLPTTVFSASATGTVVEGDLHLSLYFDTNHASYNVWPQLPDAIDLYRRPVGYDCGSFERITDEPIPWTWDPTVVFETTIEYVDVSTTDGSVYEYMIRAVDSERMPISDDPDISLGFVTHGEALIGHVEVGLADGGYCGARGPRPFIKTACPNECFPGLLLVHDAAGTDVLASHADGQSVLLYGQIYMTHTFCEVGHFAIGSVTRAEPYACLVGVEATTWSASKQLYR